MPYNPVDVVTKDTDGVAIAGPVRFCGAVLSSTGNNAVDCTIKENGTGGRILGRARSQDGSAIAFGPPQTMDILVDGIYVDVTGTGPQVDVYYKVA